MQIVLKTALAAMLTVYSYILTAAEGDTAGEASAAETAPTLIQQSGQIEGYMPLTVGDTTIDATYLADKLGVNHGKVLILHDADGGIDARGLVRTLRLSLTHAGWSTMTVALEYQASPQIFLSSPAASEPDNTSAEEDEATTDTDESSAPASTQEQAESDRAPDNNTRVAAALTYLNAQQPGPTVLIAIGESATLTETVVSQLGEQRGLVWIAPEMTLETPPDVTPILDIAATAPGADNDEALSRKRLMRQNQLQQYSQRLITGAGHGFYGFENRVVTYVRGWLSRHFVEKAES